MSDPASHDDEYRRRSSSFGSAAVAYDARRPPYPQGALRWAVGETPKDVLDIGAGTGILTRQLTTLGHRVIAVEPDPLMREQANRMILGVARDGRAEATGLQDASVDAVIAGQAWHWFDSEAAAAEAARVLRPGGRLAMLWNLRDDSEPWVAELDAITHGTDHISDAEFRAAPPLGGWFGTPEAKPFPWVRTSTTAELVEQMGTHSFVAIRDDREAILHRVRVFLTTRARESGTDAHALPYVCLAVRADRSAG